MVLDPPMECHSGCHSTNIDRSTAAHEDMQQRMRSAHLADGSGCDPVALGLFINAQHVTFTNPATAGALGFNAEREALICAAVALGCLALQ